MSHTRTLPVLVKKQFRLDDLFTDTSDSSADDLEPETLRKQARWIRDELDPMVSRHGPNSLKPDQVVMVFKFLELLRRSRVSIEHIRYSRLHMAISCISNTATRWPRLVIDEADKLLENWTTRYGDIREIGIVLYEEGGRLFGVCAPHDISKEVLEVKWSRAPGSRTASGFSRRHGDLGFKPGDWWINCMFAYHAGIIDSGIPSGRIISDRHGAYALVLNGWDELDSPDPNAFTYKAKSNEPGRFRLTSATSASRQPIRVLRTHSLHSFWAPRAGIRYDGLYKVSGWSVRHSPTTNLWTYAIHFQRLSSEPPMAIALRHPLAEEVDDYTEFKRLRGLTRQAQNPFHRARPLTEPPRPETRLHLNVHAPTKLTLPPAVIVPKPRSKLGNALPSPSTGDGLVPPATALPVVDVGEALAVSIPGQMAVATPRTPRRAVIGQSAAAVLPVASLGRTALHSPGSPKGGQGQGDYFSLGGGAV